MSGESVQGRAAAGAHEVAAHVVEFTLGSEQCAIDVDAVDSIVEMKQITRVPRAPDAIDGVMDLRGETTAVVEPREFLSIDGDSDDRNILVLDRSDDKQQLGLRVDEITEVTTYAPREVDRGDNLQRLGTDAIGKRIVKGILRRRKADEEDDQDGTEDDAASGTGVAGGGGVAGDAAVGAGSGLETDAGVQGRTGRDDGAGSGDGLGSAPGSEAGAGPDHRSDQGAAAGVADDDVQLTLWLDVERLVDATTDDAEARGSAGSAGDHQR